MTNKTNFFIKLITSIYDIKVFSKYAKEGILRSISYAIFLSFLLGGLKSAFVQYKNYNLDIISLVDQTVAYFSIILFNLLLNSLIVSIVAALFYSIFKNGSQIYSFIFFNLICGYIAINNTNNTRNS